MPVLLVISAIIFSKSGLSERTEANDDTDLAGGITKKFRCSIVFFLALGVFDSFSDLF
jgi:hypothetical protein